MYTFVVSKNRVSKNIRFFSKLPPHFDLNLFRNRILSLKKELNEITSFIDSIEKLLKLESEGQAVVNSVFNMANPGISAIKNHFVEEQALNAHISRLSICRYLFLEKNNINGYSKSGIKILDADNNPNLDYILSNDFWFDQLGEKNPFKVDCGRYYNLEDGQTIPFHFYNPFAVYDLENDLSENLLRDEQLTDDITEIFDSLVKRRPYYIRGCHETFFVYRDPSSDAIDFVKNFRSRYPCTLEEKEENF